ncbi:MAG: glycosyltransferase family 4 protein [Synechococcaceae cyanobacterium]|nr:glycosyltransferase family 4 protein [Synechococcaceae cyanobacterium]
MPRLWLVNQFANTPDLPGHTRQHELAAGLVQRGWQVSLFSSDFNLTQRRYRRLRGLALWQRERTAGIDWWWLWASPYRRNDLWRQLNMLSFCLHLVGQLLPRGALARLRGRGPELILASSPQLPAAWTCLQIARLLGCPFVLEVRDLWPQVLIDQGGKRPEAPLVRLLAAMETQLYRRAALVIVLARGAEAHVRQRGARRTAWLPNGPDLQAFRARPLPPEEPWFTLLYAGAHGEANALETVVEAARLLASEEASAPAPEGRRPRFLLVGDGPAKAALQQAAQGLPTIAFEPPRPKAAMPDLIASADAVLLSLADVPLFRYGVSPNKLYDAYAIGRPVLTTVPGAIAAEVEEHGLGLSCPPADPVALAAAARALAATGVAERQAMGQRARQLAETTYSRQRVIAACDALLREVSQP